MSDYTITTNFGAKDSLPSGNAGKVIKGSEFTTEFTNIQTAIATKADTAGDTFTGVVNFSADVAVNTNTLFVDVSEAKVGIGTTNPYVKTEISAGDLAIGSGEGASVLGLEIKGVTLQAIPSAQVRGYIATGDSTIGVAGDLLIAPRTDVTASIRFITGTSPAERMRIAASGNVGIGETNPVDKLQVTDGAVRIKSTFPRIYFQDTNQNSDYSIMNSDGSFSIYDDTNAVYRMRIDSSGNVGIGTTSPATALHIDSSGATALTLQRNSGASSNISIKYDGASQDYYTGVASVSEDFVIGTSADLNGNNLLRVTSAGNIGIGTASPSAKLDVVGEATVGSGTYGVKLSYSNSATAGVIDTADSADKLSIRTGGSEAMRIDSSGKVGIGTTSPAATLSIKGSVNQLDIETSTTGVTLESIDRADHTAQSDLSYYARHGEHKFFNSAYTQAMTIDSSGNVGIGTSSPSQELHIASSGEANIRLQGSGSANYLDIFHNASDFGLFGTGTQQLKLATNSTERMRIDSTGNVLVGTTSNVGAGSQGVQITGTGEILTAKSSTALRTHLSFINLNGIVGSISTSGSATAYNTSSDERLKQNIQDADDAGSKVDAIQIRQFDWKADGSHQDYGVIAQELATVAPEAVYQPEDSEEMMGVDYSKLVPMLIKEVQSLRSRVAELENV